MSVYKNGSAPTGQATMAASIPTVVASDQTAVPVSGTVTANLGTIADVATQTTLALIKAKTDNIPAQGQALAGASLPVVQPAIIKTLAEIQDWTAVAQNTLAKSAVLALAAVEQSILYIQAALDTTTAHTGTRFIVQVSSHASGDEDWQILTEFVALIGTAATDLIENNPLAAGATAITLTAHALTVLAKYLFIKDGTLVNSELVFESAQSANLVTIIDGTTNEHAVNTAIFNVAMTQNISIPKGVTRLRVLVDNTYSAAGSTLNYKVRIGSSNN